MIRPLPDSWRLVLFFLLIWSCQSSVQETPDSFHGYYKPWESLGELFVEVQQSGVFSDSKTFVDCNPKTDPSGILNEYLRIRDNEDFDLKLFIEENFIIPLSEDTFELMVDKPLTEHLKSHWSTLRRFENGDEISTLITLPNEFVIPGGGFREVYYWDSYFTMIGLGVSGRQDLLKSMLDNFSYLIDTLGFIPNGNRTYYLGRSQPPFYASMVGIYAQITSLEEATNYLEFIQEEYNYWMKGSDQLDENNRASARAVYYEGTILNRYWDANDSPRPESYLEDLELAQKVPMDEQADLFRNLRAGAESGWDYSSRWLADPDKLESIRVIDILPVDLNSIMYSMETMLWRLYQVKGDEDNYRKYLKRAEERYNAMNELFWNDEMSMYQDVLWKSGEFTNQVTAASFFPMYFKVARRDLAIRQVPILMGDLLDNGGIRTTTYQSGQQWDSPNGWAPLQWCAIKGLEHYRMIDEAEKIKTRWIRGNEKVFLNTGKMMEKYNVSDTTLLAGGGGYPSQDGFGWTNGVYLGLTQPDPKY